MKEKQTFHVNGYLALIVLIALMIGGGYLFYDGIVRNAVCDCAANTENQCITESP